MTTIHFVKDGKRANGDRITTSFSMPLAIISEILGGYETKHSSTSPTICPEVVASDFAPYKHVVVEIGQGDTNSTFPKVGYYVVLGLNPSEARHLFALPDLVD